MSASPEALYLDPCSISTEQCGSILLTCSADCLASSILLTMMRDRTAAGLAAGVDMRDRSEMNTVVFPEPVGSETPMRVAPLANASVQASRQCSWYGRKRTRAVE